MKVKEGKMLVFVLSVLIMIGTIGLIIYQAMNKNFDSLNLLIVVICLDVIEGAIEKK